jgi:atypical dual specificity phosphatase
MPIIKSNESVYLVNSYINTIVEKWIDKITINYNIELIKNKDHEYHITIIDSNEFQNINENIDIDNYSDEFISLGLGTISNEIFYIVCEFPDGNQIREKLNLPKKNFIINLGYKNIDTQYTDINTIIEWEKNFNLDKINILNMNKNIINYFLNSNYNFNEEQILQIVKKFSSDTKILKQCEIQLNNLNNISSILLHYNIMKMYKTNDDEIINYLEKIVNNTYYQSSEKNIINKIIKLLNKYNIDSRNYEYETNNNLINFIKSPRNFTMIRENLYGSGIPTKDTHIKFFKLIGISDVITLMEDSMHNLYKDTNINYHYFKINDLYPPTNEQLHQIINIINSGTKTVIHCFGGVGRTATALIGYLMLNEKLTRLDAIEELNKTGRKTILSTSQEKFLKDWYNICNNTNIQNSTNSTNSTNSINLPKLPNFIMFVGYPASGKSTLSKSIENTYTNVIRINKDEIRQKNKCEELIGKNIKSKTVIFDGCNLTKEHRKYWLEVAFKPKSWCIFFNSDIEDCKYRITKRKNHPTIKEGTGITILNSLEGTLEEPTLEEGFEKIIVINDLDESNALMEKWNLIKPELEINNDNNDNFIIKFPRTRHIANIGSATRDDLLMTKEEINEFLNKEIYVEEKIDGANLGISINKDGKILVQNRSHYVTSGDQPQFKLLDKWIQEHSNDLWSILEPDRNILYGEWLYMKHSIKYNNLPDYFIAFDLYDKIEKKFYSRKKLENILKNTSIHQVPLLLNESFKKVDDLVKLVKLKSNFYDGQIEGIYCRICDEDYLIKRGKIVRSDFISGNIHWSKGILEKNELLQF